MHNTQAEKLLDLGTLTRPPSTRRARKEVRLMCGRCTRVQGHPRIWFRRPWIFGLLSLKHHTWPYCVSVFWYTEANFSCQMQQQKFSMAISQKRHDGFSFLNIRILDKCLRKKKIRLTTHALWLSSWHWGKCMTNSYPLQSPSKRHAKTTAFIPRRPVTWVYLDLGISQTRRVAALRKVRRKTTLAWRACVKEKKEPEQKITAVSMRVLCPPPTPCARVYKYTRWTYSLG